jgi:hypothetical protein
LVPLLFIIVSIVFSFHRLAASLYFPHQKIFSAFSPSLLLFCQRIYRSYSIISRIISKFRTAWDPENFAPRSSLCSHSALLLPYSFLGKFDCTVFATYICMPGGDVFSFFHFFGFVLLVIYLASCNNNDV